MNDSIESLQADFKQLRKEFDELKVKRESVMAAIAELPKLEADVRTRIDAIHKHLSEAL